VGSKSVSTPGVKKNAVDEKETNFDASVYRSVSARGNYLAQDRPDIQFAMKEICRFMADPSVSDWPAVKRLARYLAGVPRKVTKYSLQKIPEKIVIWTDSHYAGCSRTRKSTSGGVVMFGGHCLKTWSSTQDVVALSSGEAEYYALVKAVSKGIGMKNLLQDLGMDVEIEVRTDASAAKAIASRRGCGKVRHIDVATLWVQEKVAKKEVRLVKIPGSENLADSLTKHVDKSTLDRLFPHLNIGQVSGRHPIMPQVEAK
jgi:hypothetical protein